MSLMELGCFWMLFGIVVAGIVGTSQASQEVKRVAYQCALVLYCMGMLIAGPDAVKANPHVSLLQYILSAVVLGPIATIIFGAAWSSLVSWFDEVVERGIERLLE